MAGKLTGTAIKARPAPAPMTCDGVFIASAWSTARDTRRDRKLQCCMAAAEKSWCRPSYTWRITQAPGKTKLFRLLHLIDFEHFRQTGRGVTGMEHRAWKMGPVPFKLMQEWDDPERDLAAAVGVRLERRAIDCEREQAVARVSFDSRHFSRRELQVMKDVADKHRGARSGRMVDMTHAEKEAWQRVWTKGAGDNQTIDYELAIAGDDPHREATLECRRVQSNLLRPGQAAIVATAR